MERHGEVEGEQGEGLFVLLPGCVGRRGGEGGQERCGRRDRGSASGGGVGKEKVPQLATQL